MPERLTEKHIVDNIDCGYKVKKDTCEDGIIQGWNKTDAINKLGQLEDIEEEAGIGLITLFKALKNGVYVNIPDITNGINYFDTVRLGTCFTRFRLIVCGKGSKNFPLQLYSYGKTWALTKEELL